MNNELTPFEGKAIRKEWHNDELYFSVVDVIEILTDSNNPNRYWTDLKRRSEKESGQSYAFCVSMKLAGKDGRKRLTDCANTEGILRIVMSIPSPKAEPFKLWLAEQGKRTIDEVNDPELLTARQAEIYKLKGYPDDWILKRVQSIKTRRQLTDEWKKRGVTESKEFSILTAIIAKKTFGLTPSEHSRLKNLETENLRDHMTDLELIFTALGEELTKQYAIKQEAQGFLENHDAAEKGGNVAGESLKNAESKLGIKVVSEDNFKHLKSGQSDTLLDTTEPKE